MLLTVYCFKNGVAKGKYIKKHVPTPKKKSNWKVSEQIAKGSNTSNE